MMNKRQIGSICEEKVCRKLVEDGFTVIARNFSVGRFPEIDIIAQKDGVLHFIEVKARSGDLFGAPVEAVSAAKIAKIRRASVIFMLNTNRYDSEPELVYDVAEVFFKIQEEAVDVLRINFLFSAF